MTVATYAWDPMSQLIITALQPLVNLLDSLAFIGHATFFVQVPQLDAMIQPTADSLGMQLPLLKYTLGLFLVYPFAAVLYALPNKHMKHFFSFIVGILLVQWIFGPDWIHTFASSLITYLFCLVCPAKHLGITVFIFVMGYMTLSHFYRMYTSYLSGEFDFTGTQMVLTMKLTSFAYNVQDGIADAKKTFVKNEEEITSTTNPATKRSLFKIYQARQKFAITRLPSLLEFFGYIYCFTCILAGPAFEYKDYERSIDETAFIVPTVSKEKTLESSDSNKIVMKKPASFFPAMLRLFYGILFMIGYLQMSGRYSLTNLYNPTFINEHPEFWSRLLYMFIAMYGEKCKYYFAWKIAEGASILGGFGFEGYEYSASKAGELVSKGWKGVENIDIVGFELAPNIQTQSRMWNKRTQGWLERYSYLRSNKSLLYTYFISAIWHGLYPGFFCVFLVMPLVTEVERLVRLKINPYLCPGFDPYKPATYPQTTVANIYWVVCILGSIVMLNYVAQAFSMSSFERSITAYGSLYYFGHVILVVSYVVLSLVPANKVNKDKAA